MVVDKASPGGRREKKTERDAADLQGGAERRLPVSDSRNLRDSPESL